MIAFAVFIGYEKQSIVRRNINRDTYGPAFGLEVFCFLLELFATVTFWWISLATVSKGVVVESSAGLFTYSRIERWEGGHTGVCCDGSDMHGSRPSAVSSCSEKPFTGTQAFHS